MPTEQTDETDDRCAIGTSLIPNAGRGLFACKPFAAGDRLEAKGILIAAGSVADDCTRYADHYKFRAGDHLLIPIGYAGLLNHSSQPNMEKIVEDGRVFLRALRAIAPGEELLFRYSDYAVELFGLKSDDSSPDFAPFPN